MDKEHIEAVIEEFRENVKKWEANESAGRKIRLFTEAQIWESAATDLEWHLQSKGMNCRFCYEGRMRGI